MALLAEYYKGKSFTISFVFPETYDMARIEDAKVNIGSREFAYETSGQTMTVHVASEDTNKFYGELAVALILDDSILGNYPLVLGTVKFNTLCNQIADESVNTMDDITIALTITETSITVESVLYNAIIEDKYRNGEEMAIQRKGILNKADAEFVAYNNFVEEVKVKVKADFNA
jgi:hypothetical protein